MPQKTADVWLTKEQAAHGCGITARHLDGRVRPLLEPDDVRGGGSGRPVSFRFAAVLRVWTALRVQDETPDESMPAGSSDSAALERLREVRADRELRKLADEDSQMIEVERFAPAAKFALDKLRDAGRELGERYGGEAAEIFEESCEALEKAVGKFLERGQDDGDDVGDDSDD